MEIQEQEFSLMKSLISRQWKIQHTFECVFSQDHMSTLHKTTCQHIWKFVKAANALLLYDTLIVMNVHAATATQSKSKHDVYK